MTAAAPMMGRRRGAATEIKVYDTGTYKNIIAAGLVAAAQASAPALPFVPMWFMDPSFNSGGGNILLLNDVKVGAGPNQRVGRRIRMKNIWLRYNVSLTAANDAQSASIARVCVVYDRQPNGATPKLTDIFASQFNPGQPNVTDGLSGVNPDNRDRFKIIKDEMLAFPNIGANSGLNSSCLDHFDINANHSAGKSTDGQGMVNKFIKLRGLETHFRADTSLFNDPAEIASGSLWFVVFNNRQTLANPPVAADNTQAAFQITMSSRLKYYD